MESEDSDPDIFITQLSPWRLNTFSDDFNSEELLGILPNPESSDSTRDEGEEIGKNRFAKPISEVEIQAKIGDAVPKSTKYKEKWAVNLFAK